MRKVKVTVKGRPGDYWRYTLSQWLLEIRDILESEYSVEVVVDEEDADVDEPVILVDGEVALVGVPGEEGYLIEVLKRVLDEKLGRSSS